MAEPQNLANAAVIIAAIYFLISENLSGWAIFGLGALIAFAILTWALAHQTKDQKELIKLQIEQIEANIKNLNAATAIALANTKLIMRKMQENNKQQ